MKVSNIQLPIFNGYYCSNLSIEENEVYYLDDFGEINEDQYNEINSKETYLNISKKYVEEFNEELEKDLLNFGISNIQFQELWSPKFYNYSTDEIYCTLDINIKVLHKVLKEHEDPFQRFLRDNYTPIDGYTPFVSNDVETYLENLLSTDVDNRNISVILEYLVTEILEVQAFDIEIKVLDYYCELISYNN